MTSSTTQQFPDLFHWLGLRSRSAIFNCSECDVPMPQVQHAAHLTAIFHVLQLYSTVPSFFVTQQSEKLLSELSLPFHHNITGTEAAFLSLLENANLSQPLVFSLWRYSAPPPTPFLRRTATAATLTRAR